MQNKNILHICGTSIVCVFLCFTKLLMRNLLLLLTIGFFNLSFAQQWKEMANDININLYEVVAEAEEYFKNIDITEKGSGWKAYQRWLYENEPKYYPSGVRNNIESNFVSNSKN